MSRCLVCGGSGFLIKPDETTGEMKGYPCECRKERDEKNLLQSRLISADIPVVHWKYTLDNYLSLPLGSSEIKEANKGSVDTLRSYLGDPSLFLDNYSVLWIWGRKANAGHTTLAVILATELLKRNKKVKFLGIQNFLNTFTDFEGRKEYYASLEKYEVFILDNIFSPGRCIAKGEYTTIHLFNWLNDTLSAGKHLICTSKIPLVEVDKTFEQSKNLLLKNSKSLHFQGEVMLGD